MQQDVNMLASHSFSNPNVCEPDIPVPQPVARALEVSLEGLCLGRYATALVRP